MQMETTHNTFRVNIISLIFNILIVKNMQLIDKIKSIIFKVKDYDRIEKDYSAVLDFATGGVLSKTNYTLDSVYKAIREQWDKIEERALREEEDT